MIIVVQSNKDCDCDDTTCSLPSFHLLSHSTVEPLEFECRSKVTDDSVIISCSANKNVALTCYLDDVEHSACGMTNNEVHFANISQGTHTFVVVARDDDGLVDRSEVHFEGEGDDGERERDGRGGLLCNPYN